MNQDKKGKLEPMISEDGYYAYCPKCGHYDLIPVQHAHCPKCSIELDWDWLETYKIKRE